MGHLTPLVLSALLLALAFDFINGFHDAANSIATVVSTRVLTPLQAVAWAAFFNFAAVFFVGEGVAKAVSAGLVDVGRINERVVLAGLAGAVIWNLITWWLALPTSSSHALIGGYVGAALAKAGPGVLVVAASVRKLPGMAFGPAIALLWQDKLVKTAAFIVLAPVIGMLLGWLIMLGVMWAFRRTSPARVDHIFRRGQLLSAAAYSLGHGANDAQKTMGIILGLLLTAGYCKKGDPVPPWVVLSCYAAIGMGTLFGGWRIVKTMGQKITKLRPVGGFCAESGGAISLFLATALHVPVSTTHTITGAIVGVGSVHRFSAVRWGVAGRIVWAWLLTIPMAGGIAALTYLLLPS